MRGMYDHMIEKPVLVRANRAGVYLGILLATYPDGSLRIRARRLHTFYGAMDSTTLALTGPSRGDIGPESDVLLRPGAEVIEIVAATDAAVARCAAIPTWVSRP